MTSDYTAFCAPCWHRNPSAAEVAEHGTPGVELPAAAAEPAVADETTSGTQQEALDAFA